MTFTSCAMQAIFTRSERRMNSLRSPAPKSASSKLQSSCSSAGLSGQVMELARAIVLHAAGDSAAAVGTFLSGMPAPGRWRVPPPKGIGRRAEHLGRRAGEPAQ
jgi:hypothetical protein